MKHMIAILICANEKICFDCCSVLQINNGIYKKIIFAYHLTTNSHLQRKDLFICINIPIESKYELLKCGLFRRGYS